MESQTRTFDPKVPAEVMLEVRRGMCDMGWTYKGTHDETDKHGQPVRVQRYEREAPEGVAL